MVSAPDQCREDDGDVRQLAIDVIDEVLHAGSGISCVDILDAIVPADISLVRTDTQRDSTHVPAFMSTKLGFNPLTADLLHSSCT